MRKLSIAACFCLLSALALSESTETVQKRSSRIPLATVTSIDVAAPTQMALAYVVPTVSTPVSASALLLVNGFVVYGCPIAVALTERSGVDVPVLQNIPSLAKDQTLTSRFDLLSPNLLSRMGAIKMWALERERRGENTDDLWEVYWKLFQREALYEENQSN